MTQTCKTYDAIVLGAGAAGMMCAATAGARGRSVLLVDHADRPGKKILISGGGRCNFTNLNTPPECFLSANKHFAKSALRRYAPEDFIALVNQHAIAWHEKTLGQLFCDGSAKQIVAMLLAECAKAKVEMLLGQKVRDISHSDGSFTVRLDHETATAKRLVIATGGPSIPKMGATGFAYDLAQRFGLNIVTPRPALVPLTLGGAEQTFGNLTGLAADVIASCGKVAFREAALFTHRGLSGPAILQISSYWSPGQKVSLDFQTGAKEGWLLDAKRTRPRSSLGTAIAAALPGRLAKILSDQLERELSLKGELGNLSDRGLANAQAKLSNWEFSPTGTEGYAKAEVTAGGIDTSELSSRSMEAKNVPGLFAIGEAVDVTGWLGGYNFQWAWASGWACGQEL
jgi:predicted Rossmann fold flavoprotein